MVLYTDSLSTLPHAGAGLNWWMVLDDRSFSDVEVSATDVDPLLERCDVPPGPDKATDDTIRDDEIHPMIEPWKIGFVPGFRSIDEAEGYVVGGNLGPNACSRFFKTQTGGATWHCGGQDTSVCRSIPAAPGCSCTSDFWTPNALYDLAINTSSDLMIAGYAGVYLTPDGSGGFDMQGLLDEDPGPLADATPTPGAFVAPMLAIHSPGPGDYIMGGTFGSVRRSADAGASWASISPHHGLDEKEWRLNAVHFDPANPETGFVAGQGRVIKTEDSGCTWTQDYPDPGDEMLGSQFLDVDFWDANRGVVVGDGGSLLQRKSTGVWEAGVLANLSPLEAERTRLASVSALAGSPEAYAAGHTVSDGQVTPAFLYTRTHGGLWIALDGPTLPNDPDLHLTAVAMADHPVADTNVGLVVGWSQQGTEDPLARAWVFERIGAQTTWTELAVPEGYGRHGGKLLDVALVGDDLITATAYAVGNGGLVMEWVCDPTQIPSAPVLDCGTGALTLRPVAEVDGTLSTDLQSVALSPSGDEVLIGAQADIDVTLSSDHGLMLKRDATGWSTLRSRSGKDILDLHLTSDSRGFAIAQPTPLVGTQRPDGFCPGYEGDPVSASISYGTMADSEILYFESVP